MGEQHLSAFGGFQVSYMGRAMATEDVRTNLATLQDFEGTMAELEERAALPCAHAQATETMCLATSEVE